MTTTYEQLLSHYGDPLVRLDDVCQRYLGINPALARRSKDRLPFPVFKLNPTGKAPYLLRLADLAAFIDKQLPLDLQPAVPDAVEVPTATEVATAQAAPTREIKEYALGGTDTDAGITQAPQADSQPQDSGTSADGYSDSASPVVQGA